jgi:peroxiredoxin
MTALLLGTVLPWLLVCFGAWLFVQLVRQNGRILLRLEALETGLQQLLAARPAPAGLAAGAAAPAFELPDAGGVPHALAGYRGRRVLLVFFNPGCGFCLEMARHLAALPPAGADARPVPVVVTTGGVAANEGWMRDCGGRCTVLFQTGGEVAADYRVDGTPMGYLIDEQGRIAGELVVGADALLALLLPPHENGPPAVPPTDPGAAGGPPPARGQVNRGLEHSRINRSGLTAGTPAPPFTLPRLGGGELSLDEYHGRRVLLVFSDPECGPCEHLAPHLEALHRTRADLAVVMVSRRDEEANRRKAESLGLTFPIVLQKLWQVSRLYEMFYTPMGYLIDERGVIARDVAVGPDAVLALAAAPTPGTGGPDVAPGRRAESPAAGR